MRRNYIEQRDYNYAVLHLHPQKGLILNDIQDTKVDITPMMIT